MGRTEVSLLVDDDNLHRIKDLVKQVKGAGVAIDQVLENTGVVTGSIDSAKVGALKNIRGIANVEESRHFQIAPPESDLQ
jgi:hypothetical protein